MNIHPIKTEKDYEDALVEIEKIFDTSPGTPEGDRFDILVTLVEVYEDKYYSIPDPDPIEALNYYMESRGLSRKDLEPYIGSRARVSEVLNRKRPLTLKMIQKLNIDLGISADVLIMPYSIAGRFSE